MLTIVDDIAFKFEIHFRESGLGLVSYCRDLVSVIEGRETFISCGTTWVLIKITTAHGYGMPNILGEFHNHISEL